MTDLGRAIEACINRVRTWNYVSFHELRQVIEAQGIPAEGDNSMELTAQPNMYLWAGMSDEFYAIAGTLYAHPHVRLEPASLLTYLCDGSMLQLPIAKRPPKNGYKEPHWAPVTFVWTGPRDRQAEQSELQAAATEGETE